MSSATVEIRAETRTCAKGMPDCSPCVLLPWDTEFFGFRVARVNGEILTETQAEDIEDWCQAERIRCLYFLGRSDCAETIRTADRNGFSLTDLRLTLECKVEQASRLPPPGSGVIRPACLLDVPALQTIARTEHRDTRFFSDPHFPQPLAEALYSTWIRLECEGRAQMVFVAAPQNQPLGYISCHLDSARRAGQIGLIAMSHVAQGRGFGRALVQAALSWFAEQRAERVSVVTQGRNTPAQRLYQRCGFLSASMQLWFHKWFAGGN